jgi:cation:H+ antiporter
MLLYVGSTILGLLLLVWGADRMVFGSAAVAKNLGVAPMLIGLTVVGFATSAPEILVSATAAISDATDLAIGNALGSNIANLGLVIGITALIRPLTIKSQTLQRELPVMVAVSLVPVILFLDDQLSRWNGWALLGLFAFFIFWIIRLGLKTSGHDIIEAQYETEIPENVSQRPAMAWIGFGLLVLIIGSNALVWGGHHLALEIGISDLVIGLTLVAIGTSLPELAVSIVATGKGLHGLALGNIIGSNAFNMLAVIGVAAVIHPATMDHLVLTLHLPVMLAFTVVFFFIAYNYTGTIRVSRWEAAILLAGFIGYHGYLAQQNF